MTDSVNRRFAQLILAISCCGLAFALIMAIPIYGIQRVNAQPRSQWVMKDCYTLNDVTTFLNALPADTARDAKVLAINSQRSFGGALATPYYVWYRK